MDAILIHFFLSMLVVVTRQFIKNATVSTDFLLL